MGLSRPNEDGRVLLSAAAAEMLPFNAKALDVGRFSGADFESVPFVGAPDKERAPLSLSVPALVPFGTAPDVEFEEAFSIETSEPLDIFLSWSHSFSAPLMLSPKSAQALARPARNFEATRRWPQSSVPHGPSGPGLVC